MGVSEAAGQVSQKPHGSEELKLWPLRLGPHLCLTAINQSVVSMQGPGGKCQALQGAGWASPTVTAGRQDRQTGQPLFYLGPGRPKLSRKGDLAEPCGKWGGTSVVVSVPYSPLQVLVGGRGGRLRGLQGKEMWTPCCPDRQKTIVSCGGLWEKGDFLAFVICVASLFFCCAYVLGVRFP